MILAKANTSKQKANLKGCTQYSPTAAIPSYPKKCSCSIILPTNFLQACQLSLTLTYRTIGEWLVSIVI